jgi:hypothetical protein
MPSNRLPRVPRHKRAMLKEAEIGAFRTKGKHGNKGTLGLCNRVRAIMVHGWRYAFQPTDRLAQDVGVSPRTIRRLLSGETANPPFALVEAVTVALSKDLRLPFPLLVREVFSPDGTYPTPSTCELCDCEGCLPEEAYDAKGNRRPGYEDMPPGDWSCAHHNI